MMVFIFLFILLFILSLCMKCCKSTTYHFHFLPHSAVQYDRIWKVCSVINSWWIVSFV